MAKITITPTSSISPPVSPSSEPIEYAELGTSDLATFDDDPEARAVIAKTLRRVKGKCRYVKHVPGAIIVSSFVRSDPFSPCEPEREVADLDIRSTAARSCNGTPADTSKPPTIESQHHPEINGTIPDLGFSTSSYRMTMRRCVFFRPHPFPSFQTLFTPFRGNCTNVKRPSAEYTT